jgi:hypothetical protein
MADAVLTGHCNCGAIRFELTEMPASASYCHCTRCQRRSGAGASAQAGIPEGALRFISGEDEVRWWQPPDGYAKAFCPTCGSQLFSRPPGATQPGSVRLGVLGNEHEIRPGKRIHVGTAAAWEPIPDDGLPRFHESATA